MAFPYILSTGFEAGVHGFTATSGTLIDVAHYTELARNGMAPYRGAYALRIRLEGGTTSQFLREDTAFDDWDPTPLTRWVRFYFYLGKDFVMADNDKFSLFEAESTLNTTTEIACGILRSGANLEFWWNETAAAAGASSIVLGSTTTALNKWYCAEIKGVLDLAAGTIDGYINDVAGTQITGLAQAAIVDAKFGVIGPDAGTSGTVLIDDIIYDDTTQIFMDRFRYRQPNVFVKFLNDHPIIGPGKFAVAFTDTADDATLSLYDSDAAPSNLEPFAVLTTTTTGGEFIPGHDIFEVTRGLWTVMSAITGRTFVSLSRGGHYSDAAMISRGRMQGAPSS